MFFKSELIAFMPEIFLLLVIHFLLLYGVVCTTSGYLHYPIVINNITWLSVQTLFFAFILNSYNPLSASTCFNNLLILDQFALLIKTGVLITTMLTVVMSIKYNQFENINAFESVLLVLLGTTGILLLISSFDLISIYLTIELQSFCLYILAALNRTSEFSTEAGLKYFVLGAFSSGLLLFGFSLIYGFSGLTDLGQLFQFLSVNQSSSNTFIITGMTVASIFILSALLFKLSAAPFHLWAPDIYEGSPTAITAFFAIVPKISILALLTRFSYFGFYDLLFSWQELIILASLSSIIIGTIGSLVQFKLKRLLAYSAIGHMGYILIGFGCGCFEGIEASYLYILIYISMTVLCFIIILGVYEKKNLTRLNYLKDLVTLTKSNPLLALILTVTFFSMAGVPPLAGFFSKMFLFIVAIQTSMYLIALIGVLASVVSCFYYIRIIKLSYFETNYIWSTLTRFDREKSIILAVLVIFLISIGIFPSFVLYWIHNGLISTLKQI
uniref:NADH dehydrogenase subunit 2 n=1 Tax=Chroomonas placoidea TaxID=173977 RepID=A0A2P1G816_9CRYP|nr:NADH dehydrogenase subunit 2 [Chroomonas placoidea]AVM81097.1 NADH dehydrogenase subunit 2 [Chroomonas placoidea]